MSEWTGRWCIKCNHEWDLKDSTTKPCECVGAERVHTSGSNQYKDDEEE